MIYCSKHSLLGMYKGKQEDQESKEFDLDHVIREEGVEFGDNKVNEDVSKEIGQRTLFAALYGQRLEYENPSDSEEDY